MRHIYLVTVSINRKTVKRYIIQHDSIELALKHLKESDKHFDYYSSLNIEEITFENNIYEIGGKLNEQKTD